MLIFSIIAIIIIFLLWKYTTVYRYKQLYPNSLAYGIDRNNGKKFSIKTFHVLGLLLLLIPYFNIIWFISLLLWYIKRASTPGVSCSCIIWRWEPLKYSSIIKKIYNSIKSVLNKEIL